MNMTKYIILCVIYTILNTITLVFSHIHCNIRSQMLTLWDDLGGSKNELRHLARRKSRVFVLANNLVIAHQFIR